MTLLLLLRTFLFMTLRLLLELFLCALKVQFLYFFAKYGTPKKHEKLSEHEMLFIEMLVQSKCDHGTPCLHFPVHFAK